MEPTSENSAATIIQATYRGRRSRAAEIRAEAKEKAQAIARKESAVREDPADFAAQVAAFHGAALSHTVTHRVDFANAAKGTPIKRAAKTDNALGKYDSAPASSTGSTNRTSANRTSAVRRPRVYTRFGAKASAAETLPKPGPVLEARPLQCSQESASVEASRVHDPVVGGGSAVTNDKLIAAAARATQEELRRSYKSEHAILVSEHQSRMTQLAEIEAAAIKERGLASERDAEHWQHAEEQAQAMKAEREKMEAERVLMTEQLVKLQEQSQRELTAWGDAQAADKGRLDALAAQLDGLRNERAALSAEREAMAQERKKLQKIRRLQQQQQEAAAAAAKQGNDESQQTVLASVVQKRMQRQWAAQRQAYERLERLIHDGKGKPSHRSALAASKSNRSPSNGVARDASVPAARPHRRRRRRKGLRRKTIAVSTAGTDAASDGDPTGQGLRWREVPLRRQVPPSMLFASASLCLPQDGTESRNHSSEFACRPKGEVAVLEQRYKSGTERSEPEEFALRCARRVAAMEARLESYDAATF